MIYLAAKNATKHILSKNKNKQVYNLAYKIHRQIKKIDIYISSSFSMDCRQPIHFIHIGKTGGSSVRHALSNSACKERYNFIFHNHDVRLEDIPRGHKVFFFLRDPCTRFVSGFYSRQRMGKPRYYQPWTDDEAKAFSVFDTPNSLALALSSDCSELKQSAIDAMSSILHVKDSYLYWFSSHEYFLKRLPDVLLVGFQESLRLDFDRFKEKLDLPHEVQLSNDKTISHRTSNTVDKQLSNEAIKNLESWYKSDYLFIDLIKSNFSANHIL